MNQLIPLALLLAATAPAAAQSGDAAAPVAPAAPAAAAVENSKPQPVLVLDTIPPPRDTAYPGTITLDVDASDVARGIVQVSETIPVAAPGPLVLLYPKWLPGHHGPAGPIDKLAGLSFTAGGAPVAWRRDPIDVTAFHLDVPPGAQAITAKFQFLSPTASDQGRILATPDLLSLEWNTVALYPAGYFVRDIPITAHATFPKGWQSASALAPGLSGDTMGYPTVSFETLVDPPAIAGRVMKSWELAPGVRLDVGADRAGELAATADQIDAHKRLVAQALRLFGAQHYDHYDFLLTLSDSLGGEGLEHHRSSEDSTDGDYFTDWDSRPSLRNLLPHEFVHSWNGKFRRPADLWTPDYRTPKQDDLLWVYEGLTQFWGYVLQARAGLVSAQDTLDGIADIAAYDALPGRGWRPVADTTDDPIIAMRRPIPWPDWQRSEDYYDEGLLIWLEADQIIRQQSGGTRSLDDFARIFYGVRDRDWGTLTYGFDDIVAALNRVQPYDWAGFFHARIDAINAKPPLDGITMGGYALSYSATPSAWFRSEEKQRKILNLYYSGGLVIDTDDAGKIDQVAWGSAAFDAGLTIGATIVSIDGRSYSDEAMKEAIRDAAAGKRPIELIVKRDKIVSMVALKWTGGLRYPHLEKSGTGPSGLDALLAPLPDTPVSPPA